MMNLQALKAMMIADAAEMAQRHVDEHKALLLRQRAEVAAFQSQWSDEAINRLVAAATE